MSSHQKNHKHIRKMIYPEGFDQKNNLQKVYLHKTPHSQSLLCTIYRSFLKVKLDKIDIKKKRRHSEKDDGSKWLVFLFGDILTC